jgi:hypothetical protein
MEQTTTIPITTKQHQAEYNFHRITVDGCAVKLNFPVSADDTLLSGVKDTLLNALFNSSDKQ